MSVNLWRRGRGTTLTELLVAMLILAILVTLLIPALGAARESARKTQCSANEREIGQAALTFAAGHQGYLPGSGGTSAGDGVGQEINSKGDARANHTSYFVGNKILPSKTFVCPDVLNVPIASTSWNYHYQFNFLFVLDSNQSNNAPYPYPAYDQTNFSLTLPALFNPTSTIISTLGVNASTLMRGRSLLNEGAGTVLLADSLGAQAQQHSDFLIYTPSSNLLPVADPIHPFAEIVTAVHGQPLHSSGTFDNPAFNKGPQAIITYADGHTEAVEPKQYQDSTGTTYNFVLSSGPATYP